jgi:hypothetical protein
MPRKTKIIFISVFILVGLVFLVYYISSKKNSNSSSGTNSSAYGLFGSLFNTKQPTTDSSTLVNENPSNQNSDNPEIVGVGETKIRLHQLTDFAVSGAAFFEDTRPLPVDEIPVKGGGEPAQTTTEVPLKGGGGGAGGGGGGSGGGGGGSAWFWAELAKWLQSISNNLL